MSDLAIECSICGQLCDIGSIESVFDSDDEDAEEVCLCPECYEKRSSE